MKLRREKIYDVFSDNLNKVKNQFNLTVEYESETGPQEILEPLYICPLCLRGYLKIALSQKVPNPLTLEDVPPRSLGGKPLILTCKKCNNTSGSLLDSVLIKHLQSQRFFRLSPGSAIEGKVAVNDKVPVKSLIRIEQNKGFYFLVDSKNMKVKEHFSELETNIGDCEINFTVKIPDRRKADIALLRIGYLLAFNYLGNLILLSSNIHKIDEQILNPDKEILQHLGVKRLNRTDCFKPGLYFVKEPADCRSFFVTFSPILNKIPEYFGTFIPGPGESGWINYENIKKINKDTRLTFRDVTFNDMISNSNLVNGYHYLWKYL